MIFLSAVLVIVGRLKIFQGLVDLVDFGSLATLLQCLPLSEAVHVCLKSVDCLLRHLVESVVLLLGAQVKLWRFEGSAEGGSRGAPLRTFAIALVGRVAQDIPTVDADIEEFGMPVLVVIIALWTRMVFFVVAAAKVPGLLLEAVPLA